MPLAPKNRKSTLASPAFFFSGVCITLLFLWCLIARQESPGRKPKLALMTMRLWVHPGDSEASIEHRLGKPVQSFALQTRTGKIGTRARYQATDGYYTVLFDQNHCVSDQFIASQKFTREAHLP